MSGNVLTGLGLRTPVVAAPMAGGPSTPELVTAVTEAGGLGFLAAGYRSAADLAGELARVRSLTGGAFGVNVFVPGPDRGTVDDIAGYAHVLTPLATRLGVALGTPHPDDDDYPAKLDLLASDPVPLVSFTFGCPSAADVRRLRDRGTVVALTVTTVAEATAGQAAGVDLLVVQGDAAGGHRASFVDDPAAAPGAGAQPLAELLSRIRAAGPLPLIGTGGLMDGSDVASVLAVGAIGAQLGTAFLDCPESGTNATHRRALRDDRYAATAFTRAFTGRTARGLVNEFMVGYAAAAPAGYPSVHQLTRPLRAAAARHGDADALHLWAGTGWRRLRPMAAGDLVRLIEAERTAGPRGAVAS
ncbi:nitronate monooxygenase [Micromonospora zhanjiangensis]|uniref:Propionate 3-nitronate monooxygenase n=1 Tax=Micromonospora zhanjiangensis TaxID=1522057 RepID=A0ABV8KQG2_9ACTN